MPEYWCFICSQKFPSPNPPPQCPVCHEQAFQQITPQSHPESFTPYTPPPPPPPPSPPAPQPSPFLSNIMTNTLHILGVNGQENIAGIINRSFQIMNTMFQNLNNSGQNYRPASQQEIDALQVVSVPTECAICQTQGGELGFKLRCGHQFHQECLRPWLQRANTCPKCRAPL